MNHKVVKSTNSVASRFNHNGKKATVTDEEGDIGQNTAAAFCLSSHAKIGTGEHIEPGRAEKVSG